MRCRLLPVAYHFVHFNVILVSRQFLDLLKIKAQSYLVCTGHLCQKAVVIALSPAEPVVLGIECHARNNCHIYVLTRI